MLVSQCDFVLLVTIVPEVVSAAAEVTLFVFSVSVVDVVVDDVVIDVTFVCAGFVFVVVFVRGVVVVVVIFVVVVVVFVFVVVGVLLLPSVGVEETTFNILKTEFALTIITIHL